jgi:putative metallohydrolase (TIGR04338 family)
MIVRARDSQKGKVYAAERSLPELRTIQFADLDGVAKYTRRVVASKWFNRKIGYTPKLTVVPKRSHGGAHCNVKVRLGRYAEAELAFSRGSFSKLIVLHELAHIPKTPTGEGAHGRSFARLYLALVRRFLGVEVEARLRLAFKAKGAKWIRTGSRKGNPDALLKWLAQKAARPAYDPSVDCEGGGDGPDD